MNVIPSKLERIYESDDYQDGATYSTQVCIIGSGCGGATLAKRLTDFGVDVIVLEQGSYVPAAKMDQREINMVGRLYADRGFGTASDSSTTLLGRQLSHSARQNRFLATGVRHQGPWFSRTESGL